MQLEIWVAHASLHVVLDKMVMHVEPFRHGAESHESAAAVVANNVVRMVVVVGGNVVVVARHSVS